MLIVHDGWRYVIVRWDDAPTATWTGRWLRTIVRMAEDIAWGVYNVHRMKEGFVDLHNLLRRLRQGGCA